MSSLIEAGKGFDLPIKDGIVAYWRAIDVSRSPSNESLYAREFITKYLTNVGMVTRLYSPNNPDANGNPTIELNSVDTPTIKEISLTDITVYAIIRPTLNIGITSPLLRKTETASILINAVGIKSGATIGTGVSNPSLGKSAINAPTLNQWQCLTFQRNKILKNNIEVAYDKNDTIIGDFIFNNILSYSNNASLGYFAEMVVYNVTHDAAQLQTMYEHFRDKYDLERSLPDLMLHYDAAQGITVVDTDRVDTWADQSGEGKHAIAATTVERAHYITSDPDFNNLPCINITGQRRMNHDLVTAEEYTYTVVLKYSSKQTVGYFHASKNFYHAFGLDNTYKCLQFQARASFTSGRGLGTTTYPTNTAVITYTNNKIFVNGVEQSYQSPYTYSMFGNLGLDTLFRRVDANLYFIGKIAEIKAYRSIHSDSEILTEAQSLMTKYGIV